MYELVLKNVKHPSKRTETKLANSVSRCKKTKLKYKSFIARLSLFMGMFDFIENEVLKCDGKEILFCRPDDVVTHKFLKFRFKKILCCNVTVQQVMMFCEEDRKKFLLNFLVRVT